VDLSAPKLRLAGSVVGALPSTLATPLARGISLVAARSSPDQRAVVARNLRRVHGPGYETAALRRDVQGVFDSYARYWLETLRLPSLSVQEIDRGFLHSGLEHVEASVARGVGPIVALPHLGGWEWAARWLVAVRGLEVAAVVERLEPDELWEWFLDFRRELGIEVITLGPSAVGEVSSAIAAGRVMCLLCDRDLSGTGIEVEFFGERTRLPGGPALMALRTGAPLLPAAIYFEGDRSHGIVEPPLDTTRRGRLRDDVARVTQELARVMERQIRRAPDQWHLTQPNWPSDYEALGLPVPGAP
jgi:phosphatidylinositol dimannoside acyltransferase